MRLYNRYYTHLNPDERTGKWPMCKDHVALWQNLFIQVNLIDGWLETGVA
jgi:hypothetical protein